MNGSVEEKTAPEVRSRMTPVRYAAEYSLHVFAVYGFTKFVLLRIFGFVYFAILRGMLHQPSSQSSFSFAFSHLFAFSFFPALIIGFLFAHWFRHRIAQYVWILPVAILAFKFATLPSTSVLGGDSHFREALHLYFGGNFTIAEFYSWKDFWDSVVPNPDMARGLVQLNFTAPVYASVAYSIGTLLGLRRPSAKLTSAMERMQSYKTSQIPQAEHD